MRGGRYILAAYLIFLMLPIYWLINMSFKTNTEITTTMSVIPLAPTLKNYAEIFTNATWYNGFRFSLTYVVLNTIISISVALPAAYAFSRYFFLGDKHLFFWLLTNRMAPPAVFALPFFNLYSAIGLFNTTWAVALAHCIFNVPLAVWILKDSCPACREKLTRRPFSTATHSRVFSSASLFHSSRAGSASPLSSASCFRGWSCC